MLSNSTIKVTVAYRSTTVKAAPGLEKISAWLIANFIRLIARLNSSNNAKCKIRPQMNLVMSM
jgi:hypothetical protein